MPPSIQAVDRYLVLLQAAAIEIAVRHLHRSTSAGSIRGNRKPAAKIRGRWQPQMARIAAVRTSCTIELQRIVALRRCTTERLPPAGRAIGSRRGRLVAGDGGSRLRRSHVVVVVVAVLVRRDRTGCWSPFVRWPRRRKVRRPWRCAIAQFGVTHGPNSNPLMDLIEGVRPSRLSDCCASTLRDWHEARAAFLACVCHDKLSEAVVSGIHLTNRQTAGWHIVRLRHADRTACAERMFSAAARAQSYRQTFTGPHKRHAQDVSPQ